LGLIRNEASYMIKGIENFSLFTDFDIDLFKVGRHYKLYEKLGSYALEINNSVGTYFSVWAPAAEKVSVIGNFNLWDRDHSPLKKRLDGSGIWEGFILGITKGDIYKYSILGWDGLIREKADPFAKYCEVPPNNASIVWDHSEYEWNDNEWLNQRKKTAGESTPMTVYEVHLGSWKRVWNEKGRSLTYTELADELVAYVKNLGFTHVEFMPIMEHPYDPSWGYQVTGFFAPTSRFGKPEEFKLLVDKFHQAGIGVILDWVPSHFPTDVWALAQFDGTFLYEHADPRKGFHPDWKTNIFNFGRPEVNAFLISNALYWLGEFHIDGLRVDAVASMIFLDYSRNEGQWIPNIYGGNENLEAITFLKELNNTVYKNFPDVVTIAEESTAYPGVSKPTFDGGLGFGQKWMMGWMHDTLKYFSLDPLARKYHHDQITFSIIYAFSERFMLPLSHDEVVHMKGSMIGKMPGSEKEKFEHLRLLYGYMYSHPGTKLLFMGAEIGQYSEWAFKKELDWFVLQYPQHLGLYHWVKDLNNFYKSHPALWHHSFSPEGFEWIDLQDWQSGILVYQRKGDEKTKPIIVVTHFTPVVRTGYRIGIPHKGKWSVVLNSDEVKYGGTGLEISQEYTTENEPYHGQENSIVLTIPSLGVLYLEPEELPKPKKISKISAAKKTDTKEIQSPSKKKATKK
jgi:1,4-alpha-glucan branching enzyme